MNTCGVFPPQDIYKDRNYMGYSVMLYASFKECFNEPVIKL